MILRRRRALFETRILAAAFNNTTTTTTSKLVLGYHGTATNMLPVISSTFVLNTSIGFFSFSNAFPSTGISFPGNFGHHSPSTSPLFISNAVWWAGHTIHGAFEPSAFDSTNPALNRAVFPCIEMPRCGHAFETQYNSSMKYCNKTFFPFTSTTHRSFSLFFSSVTVIPVG